MSHSKVLFILTGSIACYKACQVISRLVQNNCAVQVVATPAALQFIGNATIEGLTGQSVITDLYAPGSVMDHIHLMRWADLILVAPATANFINKASHGIADDLVSTLFLAHDFKRPFLIAPAMNTSMFQHPVTQKSLQRLHEMGIEVLDSAEGALACGEEGKGRLLEPDVIQTRVFAALSLTASAKEVKPLQRQRQPKVLVTSGGTQESIDSVRVLTNSSSGRTGVFIAETLQDLGCDVVLLRSSHSAAAPFLLQKEEFTDFASLQSQLKKLLAGGEFTHVIHLAAVSDYSVATIEAGGEKYSPSQERKLTSDSSEMILHLKRNPKLINEIRNYAQNSNLKLIAFKLTSHASAIEREAAVQKLAEGSQADIIVHNDLSEIDTIQKTHRFNLYRAAPQTPLTCESKESLVAALAETIFSGGHL